MVKIIMRIILDQKYSLSWKRILTLELFINHIKAYVVRYVKLAGYFIHLLIERNEIRINWYSWFENNNRDSPVRKRRINIKQHLKRRFLHPWMKQKHRNRVWKFKNHLSLWTILQDIFYSLEHRHSPFTSNSDGDLIWRRSRCATYCLTKMHKFHPKIWGRNFLGRKQQITLNTSKDWEMERQTLKQTSSGLI